MRFLAGKLVGLLVNHLSCNQTVLEGSIAVREAPSLLLTMFSVGLVPLGGFEKRQQSFGHSILPGNAFTMTPGMEIQISNGFQA